MFETVFSFKSFFLSIVNGDSYGNSVHCTMSNVAIDIYILFWKSYMYSKHFALHIINKTVTDTS